MTNSKRLFAAPMSQTTAILAGGLIAATLDILYAFSVWAVRGVTPDIILKSIASGLLGRPAYQGGADVAALGLALHVLIATVMAAVYVLASRRLPILTRRPLLMGSLYGIALYGVMNYVVLPLSAFPMKGGADSLPMLIGGLLAHALLVGTPIALAATRVVPQSHAPSATGAM